MLTNIVSIDIIILVIKQLRTLWRHNMFKKVKNQNLVEIFKETRKLSKTKFKGDTATAAKLTCVYHPDYFLDSPIPINLSKTKPPIEFISGGTVSTARAIKGDSHLAVLNFADALVPGGMVLLGSSAQEENLCRCSNLYETLITSKCKTKYYSINNELNKTSSGVYTHSVIYSRGVTFFRNDITYDELSPLKFDVITCPAPSATLTPSHAYSVYVNRIDQIVGSAILNGVDTIVLGAWGCGAFHQDPRLVAKAFAYVLNAYANQFKRVVFAIRPTYGTNNVTLETFYKVFIDNYVGEVKR